MPRSSPIAADQGQLPRDEFEESLCNIWAEALGLKRVGIHDNFFDLGGTSLLAVQLLLNVQQLLPGQPIPLSAVLEAPTVVRFADWIRNRRDGQWKMMVCLRPGSSRRPPLFCVHAAGGNVMSVRPVSMAMPEDLPIYCLQAKGLDGEEPFRTVEESAQRYVDEIRPVQAAGPYYLCGFCYGGLVAFEMARILEQRGERVNLLALIDTYNFAFGRSLPFHQVMWRNARYYAIRSAVHARKLMSARGGGWSYLKGRLVSLRRQVMQLARMVMGSGKSQFPESLVGLEIGDANDSAMGRILNRVQQASLNAASQFVPKPYGGRGVVIKAAERRVEPYEDEHLGWGPVMRGGVRSYEVDGGHDTMNAPATAEILNLRLLEASGGGRAGSIDDLRERIARQDPECFAELRKRTLAAASCEEILQLSSLRKQIANGGVAQAQKKVRIAVLGGYTLFPFHELVGHLLAAGYPVSWDAEFLLGDFDNYIAEIMDRSSRLYAFDPEVIFLLPSHRRCQYDGSWFDPREQQEAAARAAAAEILDLCRRANALSAAEVVLANFPLPGRFDPGPYRSRTLASEWSFRKLVNTELGLGAPSFVHICDVEFLSARRGTLDSWDAQAWFETKQPYGGGLMLDVAREASLVVSRLREGPKKAAVLDLDNTLWGGVIGDDGLEGIELGDTSPRGEAFKAFQHYLASLSRRGVLLAVASKNDREKAVEPFEKHPEMVLRLKDIACFKANWQPKSDSIREIAQELNLGLDSLVFLDDNPAEIEIVKQFVPAVTTILLPANPSEYVAVLEDSRCFEPQSITEEDLARAGHYRQEAERREHLTGVTDMAAYLESLHMSAAIREFRAVDVPRIAQLINKSNQFNLTTRRRTEAQVQAIVSDPAYFHFTVRLADRFGDNGLISVVIGKVDGEEAEIDTWLMSCRVLKRQVEDEVLNQIVRLALQANCSRVRGMYLPTDKNGMVRDLYPEYGFTELSSAVPDAAGRRDFVLDARSYRPRPTKIRVTGETLGLELSEHTL